MIIAMDEVGKGAVAGPIAVGCIAFPQNLTQTLTQLPYIAETRKNRTLPYRDSKQLSQRQRETIYNQIIANPLIHYHVAYQTNEDIDNLGISECTRLAVADALTQTLKQINRNNRNIHIKKISIDHMPNIKPTILNIHNTKINMAKQGDAKFLEIALASIIAKVERDNLMALLCQTHKGYNLAKCKGYLTKEHSNGIHKYGLSSIHRKSIHFKHPKLNNKENNK